MEKIQVIIVGAGLAGLSAGYTLQKRGIQPLILESTRYAGGRSFCDQFDGYSLDTGADFFCDSYDQISQLCRELDIKLIKSLMTLGWSRNGKWYVTKPLISPGAIWTSAKSLWRLGFLDRSMLKLLIHVKQVANREPKLINFASDSRVSDLDDDKTFEQYLNDRGISDFAQVSLKGFLEMTMGFVEDSGWAYMRSYISEMLLNNDRIFVPENGAGEFMLALADKCRDNLRYDSPVERIEFEGGRATGVIVNGQKISADAVICTSPGNFVSSIAPDLPAMIREPLDEIAYSTGVRVVIGLDHSPLPPKWNGALYPEDNTPLLLDRSLNLPNCVPPGYSTLDMLVGRERALELIDRDDDEIYTSMLEDVYKKPPPDSNIPKVGEWEFAKIYRWRNAVCMGQPNMFKNMSKVRQQISDKYSNFWLAGDYLKVPCVNGAVSSGIETANEVADMLESQPANRESPVDVFAPVELAV